MVEWILGEYDISPAYVNIAIAIAGWLNFNINLNIFNLKIISCLHYKLHLHLHTSYDTVVYFILLK